MIDKLTARRLATIKAPGKYGDGGGLWPRVRADGRREWVLRYRFQGRDREMGLGGEYVSLKEARHSAAQARRLIREGLDPIEERRKGRGKSNAPTFRKCAERFIAAHEAAWGNARHRAQWHNTLGSYVFPVLGEKPVDTIDVDDVLRVLTPLWTLRPETASRVRGRIERVLDWARARGLRHGENPARWRGYLDKLLPKRSKVQVVRHLAALPWRETPEFMTALRAREGIAERALEFAVLTAARSGEVRGMRWDEVDGDVWTVPGERIKAKREHRVPLSPRAVAILDELPHLDGVELVFPGARRGRPMSGVSLMAVLRRMDRADLTVPSRQPTTRREWASRTTAR